MCTCFKALRICHTKDICILSGLIMDPPSIELFRVDVIRCRLFNSFSACETAPYRYHRITHIHYQVH